MMKKFFLAILLLLMPICGVEARDFSGIEQVNWAMTEEALQKYYHAIYIGKKYNYGLYWDAYYLPSTKQTRTPGTIDIKTCVYIYCEHRLGYVAYEIPFTSENANSVLENTYEDLSRLYGQPQKVNMGYVWVSPQNSTVMLMKTPTHLGVILMDKQMMLGLLAGLLGY